MKVAFGMTALLSLFAAASVALAQQAGGAPGEPPVAASHATAEARPTADHAGSHADADARACLEFLTNIGVIRCAEKYRAIHGVDTDRPGTRQSVKGGAG